MINNLPKKIPVGSELKSCEYKGSELLKSSTVTLKSDSDRGVMITTEELNPFVKYLEQCKESKDLDKIVIGIYPHSNNKKLNNGIGLCDYKDADFASINIITTEKIISVHLNCITVTREIGHYIKVTDTSWKKLPDINSSNNRKKILLERIIYTMACIAENKYRIDIKSKDELGILIKKCEAVDLYELATRIKNEGVLNDSGTVKTLNVTNYKNVLGILKTAYSNLKADGLKVNGSGAFDDKTYISFEFGSTSLEFEMSLNEVKVNLLK